MGVCACGMVRGERTMFASRAFIRPHGRIFQRPNETEIRDAGEREGEKGRIEFIMDKLSSIKSETDAVPRRGWKREGEGVPLKCQTCTARP